MVVVIEGVFKLFVCACVFLSYVLRRAQEVNNSGGSVRDIYTGVLRFDTFLWYLPHLVS